MPAVNVARQHHTDCGDNELAPTPTTSAAPDLAAAACPTGTGSTRHVPSALYNIFPKHPDLAKGAVKGVHLESYNNASQVEQVVVFSGIPADAKSCSFGWEQGERISRVFIVKGGDALSDVKQLSGFPAEGEDVTYASVKPFDDAEENVGGIDFTNWDDLDASSHLAGGLDCAETLYFKVKLRNPDGNTKVYLGQDEENGFHITYSC
ncbi:hypothetical protein ACJ41O_006275 [Fusarium nematophilum]